MSGPSTGVLNDEVKELREDFPRLSDKVLTENQKVSIKVLEDYHRLDAEVKVLASKVGGILTLGKILTVLTLTSLGSSIGWGATLTADVKAQDLRTKDRFEELDKRLGDKFLTIDRRFDATDKKLDRLETMMIQLLEQTKPITK